MHRLKILLIILIIVSAGIACSTQSENNQNNPASENRGSPSAEPTATATLASPSNTPLPDGEAGENGELPPVSYDEILQTGIDSGLWTEGEGLTILMKHVIGEEPQANIPGVAQVVEKSATGLVRHLQEYLESPDLAPQSRTELERLFRILIPPQDVLDAISEQLSSASAPKRASIRPLPDTQTQEICLDLSGLGYDSDAELMASCYFYQERVFNNSNFRIYYPYWWEEDEAGQNLVNTTFDALADSANTFSTFSALRLGNVNLIFPIQNDGNTYGAQAYFDLDSQACPLTMYPLAFTDLNTDKYKQVVAHELFHCVQDYSFPNTKPYGTHSWWMEGSADYFSNLVYPQADLEWEFLNLFDSKSPNVSILDMTYENFVFFQFMGNKYSPEVLVDILMRVSAAGGRAAQETALAGVQGMDTNFNRFVVEFLSSGVRDSGGKMIKTSSSATTGQRTVNEKGEVQFTIQPFVAMRFNVDYKQEKRFLQNELTQDEAQFSGVEYKLRGDISAWSDLPPEIRSECKKDVRYLYAITSVKDSYANYDIDVTLAEKAECDPCLLGTWDVDPESYKAFMERIMAQADTGGMAINLEIDGHQYLQFVVDGKVYSQREDFAITINDQLTTIINGFGSGSYSANGEEMTVSNFLDVTESVGLKVGNGQITYNKDGSQASFSIFGTDYSSPAMGPDLNAGNTPQTRSVEYVCEQDTLNITMPDLGDLLFNRVDKILPTPIPTPGSPDVVEP
ncbi:MAG TPA: hypothetical protein VLA32_06975 [Anaerolineales bacterium]|jgi:hypothetical protein|nr:hypothetical protein [Anaerolineales bacterium]